MIQLTAQMRILVAVEPQDFRKGIDGLSRICREVLGSDPLSGTVFVFRSRRGTAIRVLSYDGQGFWLHHKRLSQGRFRYWPGVKGSTGCELLAHELQVLLAGGDPDATKEVLALRRGWHFGDPVPFPSRVVHLGHFASDELDEILSVEQGSRDRGGMERHELLTDPLGWRPQEGRRV